MLKVFAIPSDSEGPLYPSNEFKSRLWTIKKKFRSCPGCNKTPNIERKMLYKRIYFSLNSGYEINMKFVSLLMGFVLEIFTGDLEMGYRRW